MFLPVQTSDDTQRAQLSHSHKAENTSGAPQYKMVQQARFSTSYTKCRRNGSVLLNWKMLVTSAKQACIQWFLLMACCTIVNMLSHAWWSPTCCRRSLPGSVIKYATPDNGNTLSTAADTSALAAATAEVLFANPAAAHT